jgi:peptidoglycan/LPS O-acetylase OafA/YrhL
VYFGVNGYGELPFLYYFFPSILVFFLAGYLGFCIYSRVKDYTISRYIGVGGIVFFFSYIAYKTYIYGGFFLAFFDSHLGGPKAHLLFAAFALYIPFLFLVTKDSKVDRFIGGLSFSYFLSHIFVFRITSEFLSQYWEAGSDEVRLCKIMLSLVLSVFIYFIIEKPIDSFREKRVENTLKTT